MRDFVCHGDILFAREADALEVYESGYLVVQEGRVEGIYPVIPEKFENFPRKDYGRGLIIPAFTDLHIHASQYVQRGIGMDKLLFDWLNDYTFPQEARFQDMSYAKPIYDAVVRDLLLHGTFHASLFTAIHYDASDYLFRALEEKGLYAYVGKVNMDMNSPDYLCESTEESLRQTERFLAEHPGTGTVKPVLTPRFAPTCSEPLMRGLGKLAGKYHCGLQTHLVESRAEKSWTLELFKDYGSDAEIYERNGLLENGPSIFAHFIFPSQADLDIVKRADSTMVHCPDATTNIIAGIMPVERLHGEELPIALGTDVGGGQGMGVYRQISRAVQLSKLKEFYEPEESKTITFPHAFYMATKAGGRVFDHVGSLEKGYRFNALVLDNLEDAGCILTPVERAERFCYTGDERNIVARFIDGKEIHL